MSTVYFFIFLMLDWVDFIHYFERVGQ